MVTVVSVNKVSSALVGRPSKFQAIWGSCLYCFVKVELLAIYGGRPLKQKQTNKLGTYLQQQLEMSALISLQHHFFIYCKYRQCTNIIRVTFEY